MCASYDRRSRPTRSGLSLCSLKRASDIACARQTRSRLPEFHRLEQTRGCGNYLPEREVHNGTQILQEGIRESRSCDEEAQERHAEKRTLGAQGQEPQTGDRDRVVGGSARGQEGAAA